MATEIKTETFDSFVKTPDKAVLIDFWATSCGPCRMLSPIVEAVAEEKADSLVVGKVNVDDCPELAQRFGVMSIPTLLLFRDGELVDKSIGYMPKAELEKLVEKAL